jgi:tetratricopeptide (TPR) repeat protein
MRSVFVGVALLVAASGHAQATAWQDSMQTLLYSGAHASLEQAARRTLGALPAGASRERYQATYYLAHARHGQDDPVGALALAQEALLLARSLQDTADILRSMYQLVKFNVEGRHYAEADRMRREQLALALRYGRDARQIAIAHNSVGSMYSRSDSTDLAEHHYRAGLAALGDGTVKADLPVLRSLLSNLATTLSEKGRHAEATKLHARNLTLVDTANHLSHAWAVYGMAQSLLYEGRYREAIERMDRADSLNRRSGNTLDLAIDLAELRADCLDSIGDIAGAYAMVKLARDLQDTLFERSMDAQYLELEKKFGTRLKEEEIQRLDAQSNEQQERLRTRNLQLYGSLALAALAIVGAALVWRNLRQKRRHTAVLEQLNTELRDRKERIEEINRLLQLKVLRTQMNPHFIYNSLNAIHNLVRKGDGTAAGAYLDGFSRLLRMVLDHSVKDRIPLEEEVAFLRHYLALEAMRFEDGLAHSVEADPALLADGDHLVPALIVQPFVENAVWHGLASKPRDRRLHVLFTVRNERIVCVVEDNGVGRRAAPKHEHPDGSASLGVQLTNERLQLLAYKLGDGGRVTFTDLTEGDTPTGTRVEILL